MIPYKIDGRVRGGEITARVGIGGGVGVSGERRNSGNNGSDEQTEAHEQPQKGGCARAPPLLTLRFLGKRHAEDENIANPLRLATMTRDQSNKRSAQAREEQ